MTNTAIKVVLSVMALAGLLLAGPLFFMVPHIVADREADLFWQVVWAVVATLLFAHYTSGAYFAWSHIPPKRQLVPTLILNGIILPAPIWWSFSAHWTCGVGAIVFSLLWWLHYLRRTPSFFISPHARTTGIA